MTRPNQVWSTDVTYIRLAQYFTFYNAERPHQSLGYRTPDEVYRNGWLDFWVICDDKKCYMFATDDNGRLLRSETELSRFPNGFHNAVAVMTEAKDDLFEASNTCKVANTNTCITLVEAISPKGRYFRI